MLPLPLSLAPNVVSLSSPSGIHVSPPCNEADSSSAIEMAGFFLLNLGLPVLNDLGSWQKFADGLFQSLSVRASGFGILPVSQFAPALL